MADIPTFPPAARRGAPWVVLVAVGVASGGLGAWLIFWLVPAARLTRIPPGTQSVIVEHPGQVVVEESTRLRDLREQNQRFVGRLVKAGAGVLVGASEVYPPSATLGEAVMLTSDGWFVTVNQTNVALDDRLLVEGQPYQIRRLLQDPSSSLVLGQVGGSTFTPALFTDPSARYPGMTVFGLTSEGLTAKTALLSEDAALVAPEAFVADSDTLSLVLELPPAVRQLPFGTPIFGLDGSLVGIMIEHGSRELALPAEAISTLLESVLEFGKPARSSFGVAYVFEGVQRANVHPAAVVYGGPGRMAVQPQSAAARAGLAAGDRIVAINGEALRSASNLFTLIQSYRPNTTVIVTVDRRGRSFDLSVTLGSVNPTPR